MSTDPRLTELEAENHQLRYELKIYRERFKTVFESSGDSIFIIDLDTARIVTANSLAERRFGYCPDDLRGMEVSQIEVLPDNPAAWMSQMSGTQIYECHYRRKDGELVPVEVSSRANISGDHNILVNVVRDITVRKKIESEREQLIRDLDAFAHTVAHDLKTPLGVILGYITLLSEGELSPEEREQFLDGVARGTYKMRDIINELLLFASVNKNHVTRSPLDMETIVQDALTRIEFIRHQANAEITLPHQWPTALGYGPWIEGVWVNFITNAIKYGGTPPQIELGADDPQAGSVRFWVRDNGVGIDQERMAGLFQEFARLNTTTEGHGLGLSIVRRIVDKLGGTVNVESTVGAGSVFSFTLPTII